MKPNANYGRVNISGVTKTLPFIRSSSNSRAALNVLLSIMDLTMSSANSVHISYPTQYFFTNLATVSALARHIRDSSEQKLVAAEADCNWWKDGSFDALALAIAHDELKHAFGWYDDYFYGWAAAKNRQKDDQT
jgi:hypothetical protein